MIVERILVDQADTLTALAQKLAPEPLFQRYGLSAPTLAQAWTRALQYGDTMLCATGPSGPEAVVWFTPNGAFGRGAYLRLLAVVPSAQAKGLGRQMLAAYEAACAAVPGGWFLLCSDFNVAAQRFYSAQGYRRVGSLPGFVLPDVQEIVFHKPNTAATRRNQTIKGVDKANKL